MLGDRPDPMRRRAAALALPLLLSAALAQEEPAPPSEVVAEDVWFVTFQGDERTGWLHERRSCAETAKGRVWTTETEGVVDRAADGAAAGAPARSTSLVVEDDAGTVLRFATTTTSGDAVLTREGTVSGGVVTVVADGKSSETPCPEGAVGPAAVLRRIVGDGLRTDAEGTAVEFLPSDPGRAAQVTWKVGKSGRMDVFGRPVTVFVVTKTDAAGISDVLLLDPQGRTVGGTSGLGTVRRVAVEEPIAKSGRDPARLLGAHLVRPGGAAAWTARPKSLRLRLRKTDGSQIPSLPEEGAQRIVARGDAGVVDLAIDAVDPPAGTPTYKRPYAGGEDMSRYLAATRWLEIDDPTVRDFAGASVTRLRDALPVARSIGRFVRDNFKPRPPSVGFASARETLTSFGGDSSEAAVLVVAFARAAGLPARAVGGIVHFPTVGESGDWPQGAFGPHVWAEVWCGDGLWFPVDPLRSPKVESVRHVDDLIGKGGFDATHIAVTKSALDTDRPFTEVLQPVLDLLRGLSIEVLPEAGDDR